MLFAFPVLFASVFLLNLEIIIRAVIIKDLIIPLPQEMAVLIDLCLNKVTFRPKDIQRAVYIVKLIGRFFQKFRCGLIGRTLAAGFQDPCINQIREDCIDVVIKLIFLFQFPADFIHLHLVVDGLKEKIASPVKDLLIII